MSKLDESYTVSTSHVKLRTVIFVVALVVAVASFSYGVNQMLKKEPGYYEITVDPSGEARRYAADITLLYYLEGESDAIRVQMNSIKSLYGEVLLRGYQLLDKEKTYDGFTNLASLNGELNRTGMVSAQVGEELADILEDCWKKTEEGKGFNLFSGALESEWNSRLTLDDLSEFDPALHPDQAERIAELARETGKLEHFSFERQGDRVTITVSPEYLDFLEQNEYSGEVILSAGRLTEAYRLAMIREALEAAGYNRGYLTTEGGLTLSLSGHEEGQYVVYGPEKDLAKAWAGVEAGGNSAYSYLRAFPLRKGEFMYPESGAGGYYHPNFMRSTGGFAGLLDASCAVRYDGDIVAACYENIKLWELTDRAEVEAVKRDEAVLVWIFHGEDKVRTNDPGRVIQ